MDQPIFDQEFYQKLNILKLSMKIKMNQGMSGNRKSKVKGSSLEFSDFREYLLGDDPRKIDWNAYGRMDKLFVKLFVEEKEGIFRIFTDCSMSMDFGSRHKGKYARQISAALSYVVLNQLDRLYLTSLDEKGIFMQKGMTGRQAFSKVLTQLNNACYHTDLDIYSMVRTHSYGLSGMTILISDFLFEDIEALLKFLTYQKQEVLLIQVLSREELEPDMDGTKNLIDSENQSQVKVTLSSALLKSYEQTLNEFLVNIKNTAAKYGARCILAPTDQPLDQLLGKIFI